LPARCPRKKIVARGGGREETAMKSNWLPAASILVVALAGCATPPATPTAEEKQALAPHGRVRVCFQANNAHATRDAASGELRGPAVDFGRELARRLDVPFVPVQYQTVVELVGSVNKDECDVLSIGVNPERQRLKDFSPAYSQIESGYLVARSAPVASIDEVDRPGMRIAVLERGDSDVLLTRTLKSATLARTRTFGEALDLLKAGKVEALAFLKTGLYPVLDQVPDARLLEGRIQVQDIAIAVPKGRAASARYIGRLVEDLKASGFVKESIARAGVRGLMPAP
jgi:polar amino acid transport system substrate-binding protein